MLARPRWLRRDDDLGYLLRALRNTHASRLRAAGRRPREVAFDDELPAATPGSGLDAALDAHALFAAIADLPDWAREAIADLPDWAREAIVMVDVAGLSYGEAARVLRVKEATVASRLHRARRRVVAELDQQPRPVEAR